MSSFRRVCYAQDSLTQANPRLYHASDEDSHDTKNIPHFLLFSSTCWSVSRSPTAAAIPFLQSAKQNGQPVVAWHYSAGACSFLPQIHQTRQKSSLSLHCVFYAAFNSRRNFRKFLINVYYNIHACQVVVDTKKSDCHLNEKKIRVVVETRTWQLRTNRSQEQHTWRMNTIRLTSQTCHMCQVYLPTAAWVSGHCVVVVSSTDVTS